jgi:hypothetical protein
MVERDFARSRRERAEKPMIMEFDEKKLYARECSLIDLKQVQPCDEIVLDYRLTYPVGRVPVEVGFRIRFKRCTKGTALGNVLYSTTLLPGERVRLSFRNRHSIARFTRDETTRSELSAVSEEQGFMESFVNSATNFESRREARSETDDEYSFKTKGGTSGFFETIFAGPSVKASGQYNSHSTREYFDQLTQHMDSSLETSTQWARGRESQVISQVDHHMEATAEYDEKLDAGIRTFSNPNACHTLNFFFYQVVKIQEITIELERVTYRVIDAMAPTRIERNRDNLFRYYQPSSSMTAATGLVHMAPTAASTMSYESRASMQAVALEPISVAEREEALAKAKKEVPAETFSLRLVKEVALPTQAIYVDSILGKCSACEPYVERKQVLELQKLELENKKLEREIELLDKHQLYRCCPEGQGTETET